MKLLYKRQTLWQLPPKIYMQFERTLLRTFYLVLELKNTLVRPLPWSAHTKQRPAAMTIVELASEGPVEPTW
jgi:hypothetical protein